jgi:hypothetical protein
LAVIFVAFGCSKEPQYIQTVSPFDNPYLAQIDTFSVKYEIERVDSFQTSGSNQIILGYNKDTAFGTVSSASYFRLNMPSVSTGSIGTVTQGYDSMYLILKPNRAHYGDTNSVININVQRVTEDINKPLQNTSQSVVFYNKDKFATETESLGSISQTLRPNTSDTIRIKLSDALGQQIYNLYKTSAPEITTNDNFQAWFKGIRLSTDSAATNVLYGFGTTTAVMRFYYHDDNGQKVAKSIDFTVASAPYQFNSIYANTATSTFLKNLTPGVTLGSEQLNHSFYINSFFGIRTKISFPSVKSIEKLNDFVKVVAGNLQLYPLLYSYDDVKYPLFPSLYMFYQNIDLSFSGPLASSSGTGAQNGSLFIDRENQSNTRYTYDVTNYILAEQISTQLTTRKLLPWAGNTPGDLSFNRMIGADGTLNQNKQKSPLTLQLLIYKQQ